MATPIRKSPGIVEQVRVALSPAHRLATMIGAALGAIVPLSTFVVLHGELGELDTDPRWLVVIGGLLYSATTVYRWGRLAFASPIKAVGFTVLVEGVMTLSTQTWLAVLALSYLCVINAVATGVTLARSPGAPMEPLAPVVIATPRRRDRVRRANAPTPLRKSSTAELAGGDSAEA